MVMGRKSEISITGQDAGIYLGNGPFISNGKIELLAGIHRKKSRPAAGLFKSRFKIQLC